MTEDQSEVQVAYFPKEGDEGVSTTTRNPEPGLYEADFISPLDAGTEESKRHYVQVVDLDDESVEVKEGRIDPITRQGFKAGDRIIRYAPKPDPQDYMRTRVIEVKFPDDSSEWESTTLESLKFLNEEGGSIRFDTPGPLK